ncbi:MAG: HNH endonuclease [Phycisphaerae bacterium]
MDNKQKIDAVNKLIEELGEQLSIAEEDVITKRNFDAFELPDLIAQIVDYLQPTLSGYEAAIYWRLFRQAIIGSGLQHTRTSVRGLCSGTIISSSGQGENLAYRSVQKALQSLEDKGAIIKAGDTNRHGTPYKIALPEEIPVCIERIRQTNLEKIPQFNTKKDLDYYNVPENRLRIFERDSYKCHYCKKQLTRFSATLDHIQPVSKGGDNSMDNLITACLHCNSRRGNKPVSNFIENDKE